MTSPQQTLGQWLDSFLAMPARMRRIEIMAEQTNAALAELDAAIVEVANELDEIANNADGDTADAVRQRASRLRNLRPDAPVEPTEPTNPTT